MLSKCCFAEHCYVADRLQSQFWIRIAVKRLSLSLRCYAAQGFLTEVHFPPPPVDQFVADDICSTLHGSVRSGTCNQTIWLCALSDQGILQFNATGKSRALSHYITSGFAQALGTTSRETWADMDQGNHHSKYRFQMGFPELCALHLFSFDRRKYLFPRWHPA